jgi:hypothetical protein
LLLAAVTTVIHPYMDLSWHHAYCEVRPFAVACFVLGGHGFTISRTGYILY